MLHKYAEYTFFCVVNTSSSAYTTFYAHVYKRVTQKNKKAELVEALTK